MSKETLIKSATKGVNYGGQEVTEEPRDLIRVSLSGLYYEIGVGRIVQMDNQGMYLG